MIEYRWDKYSRIKKSSNKKEEFEHNLERIISKLKSNSFLAPSSPPQTHSLFIGWFANKEGLWTLNEEGASDFLQRGQVQRNNGCI